MIDATIDIRRFEGFIHESLKQIKDPKHRQTAIRGSALKFISEVVPKTPVDTGRARSSWTAGMRKIGGGARLNIGGNAKGRGRGRKEGRYKEHGLRGKGDKFSAEIISGAPHIVPLELGSSDQAPSGFVRIVLRDMAPDMAKSEKDRAMTAFRVANIKARREHGIRQGKMQRPHTGRANILRR